MNQHNTERATLAGGCFWCTEAVFKQLKGVLSVISGYAGGHDPSPTYEKVSMGTTGHAEAVQITYHPVIISYEKLLTVFFATHNPTTLNQQGADVGTQYRSSIFYHDERQKQIAEQKIEELTKEKIFADPIVTEVVPFTTFYPAEEYHQDYYEKNTLYPYCTVVINPKLQKLRASYAALLKE